MESIDNKSKDYKIDDVVNKKFPYIINTYPNIPNSNEYYIDYTSYDTNRDEDNKTNPYKFSKCHQLADPLISTCVNLGVFPHTTSLPQKLCNSSMPLFKNIEVQSKSNQQLSEHISLKDSNASLLQPNNRFNDNNYNDRITRKNIVYENEDNIKLNKNVLWPTGNNWGFNEIDKYIENNKEIISVYSTNQADNESSPNHNIRISPKTTAICKIKSCSNITENHSFDRDANRDNSLILTTTSAHAKNISPTHYCHHQSSHSVPAFAGEKQDPYFAYGDNHGFFKTIPNNAQSPSRLYPTYDNEKTPTNILIDKNMKRFNYDEGSSYYANRLLADNIKFFDKILYKDKFYSNLIPDIHNSPVKYKKYICTNSPISRNKDDTLTDTEVLLKGSSDQTNDFLNVYTYPNTTQNFLSTHAVLTQSSSCRSNSPAKMSTNEDKKSTGCVSFSSVGSSFSPKLSFMRNKLSRLSLKDRNALNTSAILKSDTCQEHKFKYRNVKKNSCTILINDVPLNDFSSNNACPITSSPSSDSILFVSSPSSSSSSVSTHQRKFSNHKFSTLIPYSKFLFPFRSSAKRKNGIQTDKSINESMERDAINKNDAYDTNRRRSCSAENINFQVDHDSNKSPIILPESLTNLCPSSGPLLSESYHSGENLDFPAVKRRINKDSKTNTIDSDAQPVSKYTSLTSGSNNSDSNVSLSRNLLNSHKKLSMCTQKSYDILSSKNIHKPISHSSSCERSLNFKKKNSILKIGHFDKSYFEHLDAQSVVAIYILYIKSLRFLANNKDGKNFAGSSTNRLTSLQNNFMKGNVRPFRTKDKTESAGDPSCNSNNNCLNYRKWCSTSNNHQDMFTRKTVFTGASAALAATTFLLKHQSPCNDRTSDNLINTDDRNSMSNESSQDSLDYKARNKIFFTDRKLSGTLDIGDGRGNELVENCAYFRNEIGGESFECLDLVSFRYLSKKYLSQSKDRTLTRDKTESDNCGDSRVYQNYCGSGNRHHRVENFCHYYDTISSHSSLSSSSISSRFSASQIKATPRTSILLSPLTRQPICNGISVLDFRKHAPQLCDKIVIDIVSTGMGNNQIMGNMTALNIKNKSMMGFNEIHSKSGYIIENWDSGAYFYRIYFLGREHSNYFGIDENFGPIAVSLVRNSVPAQAINPDSNHINSEMFNYYIIMRTNQLCSIKGSVAEEIIPTNNKQCIVSHKDVIEYVCPFININCLKLWDYVINSAKIEEKLIRFDEQLIKRNYKIGVLYCKSGQTTEEEMYNNETTSSYFEQFLKLLGDKVLLKGFDKYKGELDTKTESTGLYSLYTSIPPDVQVMFHVSTLLPFTPNNRQQLPRKRHIGNDVVTIVFQDPPADYTLPSNSQSHSSTSNSRLTTSTQVALSSTPFSPKRIRSHFQHVFLVVKPILSFSNDRPIGYCGETFPSYKMAVSRSKDVEPFGPLLPDDGIFDDPTDFRNFLLAKCINADNSAQKSEKFATMATRARLECLKDLSLNHSSNVCISDVAQKELFTNNEEIGPTSANFNNIFYKLSLMGSAVIKKRDIKFMINNNKFPQQLKPYLVSSGALYWPLKGVKNYCLKKNNNVKKVSEITADRNNENYHFVNKSNNRVNSEGDNRVQKQGSVTHLMALSNDVCCLLEVHIDAFNQNNRITCNVFENYEDNTDSNSLLNIEHPRIVFAIPTCSIIGWKILLEDCSLTIYFNEGNSVVVYYDEKVINIGHISQRLKQISLGKQVSFFEIQKDNKESQLGFYIEKGGYITDIEMGGLAWNMGLRKGFRIVEICDKFVVTMKLNRILNLLKKMKIIKIVAIPPLADGTAIKSCQNLTCNLSPLHSRCIRLNFEDAGYMMDNLSQNSITIQNQNIPDAYENLAIDPVTLKFDKFLSGYLKQIYIAVRSGLEIHIADTPLSTAFKPIKHSPLQKCISSICPHPSFAVPNLNNLGHRNSMDSCIISSEYSSLNCNNNNNKKLTPIGSEKMVKMTNNQRYNTFPDKSLISLRDFTNGSGLLNLEGHLRKLIDFDETPTLDKSACLLQKPFLSKKPLPDSTVTSQYNHKIDVTNSVLKNVSWEEQDWNSLVETTTNAIKMCEDNPKSSKGTNFDRANEIYDDINFSNLLCDEKINIIQNLKNKCQKLEIKSEKESQFIKALINENEKLKRKLLDRLEEK
ncbi:uncharacterized protein LOC135928988 isoform X3 [Gordionus sp. m RMFG-2023]|uniref:uncharacterized protein LOC135928988 isoform X3 n=1 Tax=Gordionus sp. m RMFG-2023 TaxID=3053472 RepID=UPI0031FCABD2